MFTRFFRKADDTAAATPEMAETAEAASLREKVDSWRFRRDLAAIMATFDRLSDRRLEMIGLQRDSLFESVSDMMIEAERQRAIGREVVELLENPSQPETADRDAVPAREGRGAVAEAA